MRNQYCGIQSEIQVDTCLFAHNKNSREYKDHLKIFCYQLLFTDGNGTLFRLSKVIDTKYTQDIQIGHSVGTFS